MIELTRLVALGGIEIDTPTVDGETALGGGDVFHDVGVCRSRAKLADLFQYFFQHFDATGTVSDVDGARVRFFWKGEFDELPAEIVQRGSVGIRRGSSEGTTTDCVGLGRRGRGAGCRGMLRDE